jgi:2-phosphoglycolate phosphatase
MRHPGTALQAVIFDLDGTLVDTADDFVPVVQQLRREYGLEPMPAERIRQSVSNGASALVTLSLSLTESDPAFPRWRERLLAVYGDILGNHAEVYPGLRELLAELEARQLGWGVATNKPRGFTLPLLERLGLTPGSTVCPEDVSRKKPDPESLAINCAQLGCEPAASIYVGDHARDIEAGRRAGMYTVAAAYGYIEPGDDPGRWGADVIVDTPEALAGALLNY